jgi:hypothetical protein
MQSSARGPEAPIVSVYSPDMINEAGMLT